MSQPPNTISLRSAKGTTSLILGNLFSSFFPKRILANWVIEPIGFANPFLTANVPTTNVEATAPPTPTTKTPNLPSAFFTLIFSIILFL